MQVDSDEDDDAQSCVSMASQHSSSTERGPPTPQPCASTERGFEADAPVEEEQMLGGVLDGAGRPAAWVAGRLQGEPPKPRPLRRRRDVGAGAGKAGQLDRHHQRGMREPGLCSGLWPGGTSAEVPLPGRRPGGRREAAGAA